MLMWKIVGALEVSVLYIYIDYYITVPITVYQMYLKFMSHSRPTSTPPEYPLEGTYSL